ncbi:MAG: type IV pilus modification PilV family protein, partial [Vulcanimicrobiaceae bacterium]
MKALGQLRTRASLRDQLTTRASLRAINRGFTAIEVMLALTLLAIGTAGVVAMEQASIDGNYDARRLDVANSIMRLWIERLRSDGTMWTMPNPENPVTDNRASAAVLLAAVDADPTIAAWHLPIAREGDAIPLMPVFDLLGNDITVTNPGTPMFCVHTRLSWLVTNQLMRAEVRVFWPKGTQPMSCAEPA